MLSNIAINDRTEVKELIKDVLNINPHILFAYFHGSFITNTQFPNDIDIFIYTKPIENIYLFQVDLKIKTSETLIPKGYDIPP